MSDFLHDTLRLFNGTVKLYSIKKALTVKRKCVYALFNEKREPMYVGHAACLGKRLKDHLSPHGSAVVNAIMVDRHIPVRIGGHNCQCGRRCSDDTANPAGLAIANEVAATWSVAYIYVPPQFPHGEGMEQFLAVLLKPRYGSQWGAYRRDPKTRKIELFYPLVEN